MKSTLTFQLFKPKALGGRSRCEEAVRVGGGEGEVGFVGNAEAAVDSDVPEEDD